MVEMNDQHKCYHYLYAEINHYIELCYMYQNRAIIINIL